MQSNLNQLGLASFPNLENQPNPENGLGNNDENNNEPVLPPSEGEGREGGTSNDKDNPEPQPKPDDDASKNEEGKPNEEDLDDVDDNPDEEYYEEGEGVLEEPDPTEDENDSQGNFFEDNKGLLTRVHNILKLKFPNSNISLSQLLTGAQQYIDMIASNPKGGQGDGEDVLGERDEPESEIDISQFSDDDIDAIVNGFCKVYKTDWGEFLKIVTFYLNQDSFTQPEIKSCYFKYKKPDEQLDDIANPVNIAKYNEEFEKQNRLRISKLNNAVSYIIDSKPDNENELKKKLVEFCLNDKTAVLDYIEYLLKVFYDKWMLPDGSGDRFPYVIHPTDTKPRTTDDDIKTKYQKVEDEIKKIEQKSSYSLYAKIKGDDSEITPISNYVKKEGIDEKKYNKLKEKEKKKYIEEQNENGILYHKTNNEGTHIIIDKTLYENTNENIIYFTKDAENNYNETFNFQLYGSSNMDANSRFGKGAPDLMYNVSSYLYNRLDSNEKKQFKKYLHNFGIGVDCSGYVSRALSFVMNKLQVPIGIQIRTLGPGYGRVKSNCTTLATNCNTKENGVTYYYFQDSSISGSYLLLTRENAQKISTGLTTWFSSKNDFINYIPFIIPNSEDNKQMDQINDLILITKLTKKKDESKNIFGAEIKEESLSSSTKLQPGDIITTSNPSFHVKIVSKVNNDSYSHHQSTSSNRTGVIESTIDAKKIKKDMKNYWFARPYVFSNDKKLIEYFKNMLIAKGKESN